MYSIGAAAKVLGVPAATLRTWQGRYGVVLPERSSGGHRLYSADQLEQLRFVAQQVVAGLSPADAHRLLRDRLSHGGRLNPGAGPGYPSSDRPLIMLAVQNRYTGDFAGHYLRAEGYEIAIEVDADRALATSAELSPNLATVDLLISGGRGLELCRRLRSRMPILAASTLNLRDAALEAGASAFLRKPIEPARLVSAVRDLLDRTSLPGRLTPRAGTFPLGSNVATT